MIREFKDQALRSRAVDEVNVNAAEEYQFTAVEMITLKYLLSKLVNDSISIISAKTGKYTHWNEDPIYLSILKTIVPEVPQCQRSLLHSPCRDDTDTDALFENLSSSPSHCHQGRCETVGDLCPGRHQNHDQRAATPTQAL